MFDWLDDNKQKSRHELNHQPGSESFSVQMAFPPADEVASVYAGLVKSTGHIPNTTCSFALPSFTPASELRFQQRNPAAQMHTSPQSCLLLLMALLHLMS